VRQKPGYGVQILLFSNCQSCSEENQGDMIEDRRHLLQAILNIFFGSFSETSRHFFAVAKVFESRTLINSHQIEVAA
jgi:hypothetical protein